MIRNLVVTAVAIAGFAVPHLVLDAGRRCLVFISLADSLAQRLRYLGIVCNHILWRVHDLRSTRCRHLALLLRQYVMAARRSLLTTILIALAGLTAIGAIAYATACPCGPVPGVWLFGERAEAPVNDWKFANDAPLCQVQVYTWKPHAINLNCMSDNNELFVSCSNCDGKSWSGYVAGNPEGNIKIEGIVYPVTFRRITAPAELDRIWLARLRKIKSDSKESRPNHWWSFKLESRAP